jgi:phage baseplate assembly protein W
MSQVTQATSQRSVPYDRLGTGWSFPPRPAEDGSGTLDWRTGAALVRQSILLILDTEPGERVMRPEFGCGLRRFLMSPNTPTTRAAIARDVEAALRTWEPRIELQEVDVATTDDPATVMVSIAYTHVRDRTADVLAVPFTLGAPVGSTA